MDTPKLQDAATQAQAERHAEHPWADRIATWLDEREKNISLTSSDFLTAREVFVMAMQGHDSRFGRKEQIEIARAMRQLGWERGFTKEKGRTIAGYRRETAPHVKPKEGLDIFGDLI